MTQAQQTSTKRRTMLTAVASELPATVTAPSIAESNPDAELLALWRKFQAIAEECNRMDREIYHLEDVSAPDDEIADIRNRADHAHARCSDLGVAIQQAQASTLAGLVVKARCANWCRGGFDGFDDSEMSDHAMLDSMLRDLLAMDTGFDDSPTNR